MNPFCRFRCVEIHNKAAFVLDLALVGNDPEDLCPKS